MSTAEEQLLNYIDGSCSLAEKMAIEAKINSDKAFNLLYENLLAFHRQLNELDLETPAMSFTRNVMEKVNLELQPVKLQTQINRQLIYGIAAVFLAAIAIVFGYALSKSHLSASFSMSPFNFSFPVEKYINPSSLKAFLYIDLVLALVYVDGWLRKGRINKT